MAKGVFLLFYQKFSLTRTKIMINMTILEIGCCGAYCKSCIQYQRAKYPNEKSCRGCKIGYETGSRNIDRTKCKVKVCCFKEKRLQTCADCSDYPCNILEVFFGKGRAKYRKQLDYIKNHGYREFLKNADRWRGPSGKLDSH